MKINHLLFLSFLFCIILSCSDNGPSTGFQNPASNAPNSQADWLIPQNRVLDGGPGKDGIPSIDDPSNDKFTIASEVNHLNDNELILGIQIDDEVKAYPHQILDWHEIVNDEIGGTSIAITYCPLTGTGIGWSRIINDKISEFGVSGLLYNTNLMPYDRFTNSTWSQQRLDCVNGELIGQKAETFTLVETTWHTWKETYPQSQVLNQNTGFGRNYGVYPYTDYKTNQNRFLFPIGTEDDRLPFKERTLGVIMNTGQKVYPFPTETTDLVMMEDVVGDQELIVLRNRGRNFMVTFKKPTDRTLELSHDFPIVLMDNNGKGYNFMGIAQNGDQKLNLEMPTQFMGYWFSWGTFYPDIDLFEE